MHIINGNFSCGDYRRLREIIDTAWEIIGSVWGITDTVWDCIIRGVTDSGVCTNVSLGLIVITFAESAYCWISPD